MFTFLKSLNTKVSNINLIGGGSNLIPYSVNSSKVDSNVSPNFVVKIDNSTIGFDTDSGSSPIIVTYPDGTTETNASLQNVTGAVADGTYYIIKEKGTNLPYLTTSMPAENSVASPNGYVGQYLTQPNWVQLWLNCSPTPYVPKRWFGYDLVWRTTQFVKLGEFTKTAGVISTPISYALNGKYSTNAPFVYGTAVNISHNIGTHSVFIKEEISVFNMLTEYEYNPGETLMGAIQYNASSDAGSINMYSLQSAMLGNCVARFRPTNMTGYGGIRGVYRDTVGYTGAITPSKWRLFFNYSRTF